MSLLPIITYDSPQLRRKAEPVEANSEALQALIENMFETMYNASGVGLAAPQVGESIRLFIVDTEPITDELDEEDAGPLVLINPEIVERSEEMVRMEEGCLSIPEVRDEVSRPESIRVAFLDDDFIPRELQASGWLARVIQHECDHLDGVLFLDHLSPFKRRLHQTRLQDIDKGNIEIDYPVTVNSK